MSILTIILLLAGAFVVIGFLAVAAVGIGFLVRRMAKKQVGPGKRKSEASSSCNCSQSSGDECVPAIRCAPPQSHPIVIDGLFCDPHDPQFVYAGDLQHIVQKLNESKSTKREQAVLSEYTEQLASLIEEPLEE